MCSIVSGVEKSTQRKLCIKNLDSIHEDLLFHCAKYDKLEADDLQLIPKLKSEIMDLNQKAEDHMDACKLVRNKLKNFLQSQ